MKDHTLKELADIGAKASRSINGRWLYGSLTVDPNKSAYISDAPFREAFAKAVRDAVLADLVTKSDSSPDPLDIDDIRATDEFRHKESDVVETADHWNFKEVGLAWSFTPTYAELAANYLRRQHGSNEWKPCTKEANKVTQEQNKYGKH